MKVAESVDSLDRTVSLEAYADWLLTHGTIGLACDVVFSCDVVQVAVRALGQEPEVIRRAVDDVLVGHAGFCACGAQVATRPGDECVCHFDRSVSTPAMR